MIANEQASNLNIMIKVRMYYTFLVAFGPKIIIINFTSSEQMNNLTVLKMQLIQIGKRTSDYTAQKDV